MITLTSAVLADLSAVRTWAEFATCLQRIHKRAGMSLAELEVAGKPRAERDGRFRELRRSTVSDALSGKRTIKKELLDSLLAAWGVAPQECAQVVEAWRRVNSAAGQGPANARRLDEASPRELGIHAVSPTDDSDGDLPVYVQREFDQRLQDLIGQGADRGRFVLLVGGSSTGKTRSLYEALYSVVPDWWLVQPTRTQDILDLLATPTSKTIVWLDELHRFLGTDPPLTRAELLVLVRAGMIVVGTLWPDEYFARRTLRRTDGNDVHGNDRTMLDLADVIMVPDALTAEERQRAVELAVTDGRIRAALEVRDAGFTQVLAAGPDLVHWWEQAPDAHAKAVITVAADARRLGVHGPLPAELLTEAMAGYLSQAQRVTPPSSWLESALRHATVQLNGAVAALTPIAGPQAGTLGGYVIADYLAQHVRRSRRTSCPPASLWEALVAHVHDPDDLRRLASTAVARMRYGYAEQALTRIGPANDSVAGELAWLLVRRGRCGEAIGLLDRRLSGSKTDNPLARQRRQILALQGRVEALGQQAASDPRVRSRVTELLTDCGEADTLRTLAASGDAAAADQLAELLAERGCLDELRERADAGHRFAAERLADFLAVQGRLSELRQRGDAGDEAARLQLARLPAAGHDPAEKTTGSVSLTVDHSSESAGQADHAYLAGLRLAADAGDEGAASQLTVLLFDAGDRDALLAEVDAGTSGAVDRYLALLTAQYGAQSLLIAQMRQFGLNANGSVRDVEEPL